MQMNTALQGAHNTAHGYIGGTLGQQHFSFHDPFVFLLHSTADRLWALWQQASGQDWRLDPDQTYGSAGSAASINAELQPWARDTGTGVPPLRPWAPSDNQQVVKNCKDPSVVAPPRYDTSPGQELQLAGLTDAGGMWHTIRLNDSSWQPFFGDVKGVESNDPGYFSAVGCAGVNDQLQLAGLTDAGGCGTPSVARTVPGSRSSGTSRASSPTTLATSRPSAAPEWDESHRGFGETLAGGPSIQLATRNPTSN